MYETFFELSQRPFVPNPLTSRYFAGSAIEAARGRLVRCVERAEGAGLLVGPSGTGKTLLCYLLAEHFHQSLAVAMLFSGHLASRQDLLRAILFELGQPYRGMDEGELRLSLIDYLSRSGECSQGLLLVIDEAHALPLRLLEEIRMITNVIRGGQPQVRLVLSGGPALEEHFASPKLESFAQRLAARCYLEPLDRHETFNYVRSQLRAVGAEPARIFSDEAIEAVYRATDGIGRLINQVCDHALVLAHTRQIHRLEAQLVEAAWADLQQLPAPWTEPGPTSGQPAKVNVVEFGDLDEDFFAPGPELRLALPPSELHDDESASEQPPPVAAERGEFVTMTDDQLDYLDEQWDLLESDFLGTNQPGLPEVELVFDEALAADEPPRHDPLVAISYTQSSSEGCAIDQRNPTLEENEPLRVEIPCQPATQAMAATAEEELVIDRYALLDALKLKGVFDRHAVPPKSAVPRKPSASPQQPAVADTCAPQPVVAAAGMLSAAASSARPSPAAEKNLTLAEALVHHATRVEQTSIEPLPSPESMFSMLSMPAPAVAAPADAWAPLSRESLDTLAAPLALAAQLAAAAPSTTPEQSHTAPAGHCRQPAHVVALDGSLYGPGRREEASQDPAGHGELELIVVEDDPQSVVVVPPPAATPVRRQEYRQLFARLRKS
jgi:type II secretory pathway predicted ATPase ExeA